MRPEIETLGELAGVREGVDVEFKVAERNLPSSLWETVSAFANTYGGRIVLGVDDSGDAPVIIGVRNADRLIDHFYTSMRNPQKISCAICEPSDVMVHDIGDKIIIVLHVREATRRERPVFINDSPYHGTYVRGLTGDHHCTRQEVNRMMREADEDSVDSTILLGFGQGDLAGDTIARYRRRYQNLNLNSPYNDLDTIDFLRAIGAYRRDRISDTEGVTLAGLLMFGRSEAIRDRRPGHLIDYRKVVPESDLGRWVDRVVSEGNLLDAFDAIYPRLISDLEVPFRVHGAIRIDESPLHTGLREALVNLLVHADYAEPDSSVILRMSDGCLLRNPGNSRVPISELRSGIVPSRPRNPILFRMFRYVGLAEEAGTGLASIFQTWRDRGLLPPYIDPRSERYEFTLLLPYIDFMPDEERGWLERLGGGFSYEDQLALIYAKREQTVDNEKLRGLTGLHPADATKVLTSLRDRTLLEMQGTGRSTRYALSAQALDQLGVGISESGQLSLLDLVGAEVSEASLGTKRTYSRSMDVSLGSSVDIRLEEIGAPARVIARLSQGEADRIFLELVAASPLSARELARYMGRSTKWVWGVARRLRARQQISLLYPENPSHPGQKYMKHDDGMA